MKRIELMTQFTSNKTNYNQHIKFNICDICLEVVNNKSKNSAFRKGSSNPIGDFPPLFILFSSLSLSFDFLSFKLLYFWLRV